MIGTRALGEVHALSVAMLAVWLSSFGCSGATETPAEVKEQVELKTPAAQSAADASLYFDNEVLTGSADPVGALITYLQTDPNIRTVELSIDGATESTGLDMIS